MENITKIAFNGERFVESKPFFQYDYGQILKFIDLDLPQSFETHFSNYERGDAVKVMGSNYQVEIPDDLFETGLPIYLWIYLHATQNDGRTEYMLTIPVK